MPLSPVCKDGRGHPRGLSHTNSISKGNWMKLSWDDDIYFSISSSQVMQSYRSRYYKSQDICRDGERGHSRMRKDYLVGDSK